MKRPASTQFVMRSARTAFAAGSSGVGSTEPPESVGAGFAGAGSENGACMSIVPETNL